MVLTREQRFLVCSNSDNEHKMDWYTFRRLDPYFWGVEGLYQNFIKREGLPSVLDLTNIWKFPR